MTELWVLIVLFMPMSGDGLVTGWQKTYNTEKECRAALVEPVQSEMAALRIPRLTYMVARCQKV